MFLATLVALQSTPVSWWVSDTAKFGTSLASRLARLFSFFICDPRIQVSKKFVCSVNIAHHIFPNTFLNLVGVWIPICRIWQLTCTTRGRGGEGGALVEATIKASTVVTVTNSNSNASTTISFRWVTRLSLHHDHYGGLPSSPHHTFLWCHHSAWKIRWNLFTAKSWKFGTTNCSRRFCLVWL